MSTNGSGMMSQENGCVQNAAVAELPARPASLSSISLRGVQFAAVSRQECIDHLLDELAASRGGTVVTLNVDHLRRCETDPQFRAIVEKAEMKVADGMPLVWASRLQRTPLPQRVAGSDLIDSLTGAAAEQHRSIYLLGGNPGTAEAAAKLLAIRYPQLRIAGWHCPPPGFEKDPQSYAATIDLVRSAAADIVYVALGSPKQEQFIQSARASLPNTWWLGVGISFSFLCGDVHRAPQWMQRTGLEWVHRLVQEPRRLFQRYITQGLPFAAKLLVGATFNGMFQKGRADRVS